MSADVDTLLTDGHEALANGRWTDAKAAFEAALERRESPEALAGLADALWWLGETEAAIDSGRRAYAAFRRRPDPFQAAFRAIPLYFLYRISLGNVSASRGWLGRVARLIEESGLAPLAGWVPLLRAHDSHDPVAAGEWARRARELARESGDADLELCALSQLGASLVQQGRVGEGGALLDEAMAGSLGGECEWLLTVVFTSCNMISSCGLVAEVERAAQWIRAADEFTRRYGSAHLYTHCRTYHGGLLFATGDWAGAEREIRTALRTGRTAERALYGEALATLAALRLGQGRIEEAERLLEGFENHVTSAAVHAALRLARRDADGAARILHRRLREIDEREWDRPGSYRAGAAIRLEEATLLELLVEAELARGGPAEAVTATAKRLAELGVTSGCDVIAARGERALGIAAAAGDDTAALPHLERALTGFDRLAMPFEVARTRLLLARTLRERDREYAVAEARTALAGFEALGAAGDADAAAGLLRSLGVRASRGGPPGAGALTNREVEVLRLLGEGLSNQELAGRLFLTRKTVEHHVRSVLTKLGLRSRTEAAAYAVRHLDRGSAGR